MDKQKIVITDRTKVEIDGVRAVISFDEDGVVLESELGKICVEGREMRIENFEKATSSILIIGKISCVYYVEKMEKKRGRGVIK